MKRLLLSLLAALAVAGCAGNSGADETTESAGSPQYNAGRVEIAGLNMSLDPALWKEADRNSGKLILQYQPEGVSCERPSDCSRLTLARDVDGQDGDYYQINVSMAFGTTVQCNGGLWQTGGAAEQAGVQIDEEIFDHFINDPCAELPQDEGAPPQPQSSVWHSDKLRIVIRFDEMSTGTRIEQTDLETALRDATVSEPR